MAIDVEPAKAPERKFDICLKLPSFDIIEYYYEDNMFGKYYLDKIRTIKERERR